ncbi:BREX system P-loop protein BrxC [bacterium]|nr:BREX system P-loop protein BrxC [bacterium]
MKNRDLFLTDPLRWTLINEGVSSNNDLDPETVCYELKTFVCEGEYKSGLIRILEGFLASFNKPEQKAAWISGFYGSGKSHLAKVLRYLWVDSPFPDGVSARSLTKLPYEVKDLLKELSTLGTAHGGLHSAGGTLKAGSGSVRLRLLGMIFKSAGLPESYPFSKFLLHLRDDGKESEFREHIKAAGGDADSEIERLYSSKKVAEAYLKCYPHIGSTANVGPALRADYPDVKDVTIDEMLAMIRLTLGKKGKLPCTLIVLDEVQQFIGSNNELALDIQEVTEACSKQLDSRVMFLGTGQSALSDTPVLQKLMGRYVIKSHLRDNDVENVIRTVVLQKKESSKPTIDDLVIKHEGEITRQLKTTKIGSLSEDRDAYVPDYPLLPVRLRFWERVLHSVDPTGTTAQMRTQLRVAHEACRAYGDSPVGTVVPADFIYDQISTQLVQTGEMQKRFQEIIEEQKKKPDGVLRNRLCALVFLINKLPRDGVDIGVRAQAEHLADLLSDDIKKGSVDLRQKIPALLKALSDEGVLMDIEGEYRLQTSEGASWEAEFRKRRSAILSNGPQIDAVRGQAVSKAVQDAIGSLSVLHGSAKARRRVAPHYGLENPPASDGVTIWVRDGFAESESAVLADIQKRSVDDPTLHLFIPKAKLDELKNAIASREAAAETINFKGNPTTPEGMDARRSIVTRQANDTQRVEDLVRHIIGGARLLLSGGQELPVISLRESVEDAAAQVLTRLYPKFHIADSANWPTVLRKAKEGNANALSHVGYDGDPQTHPVAAELLKTIGAGKKGTDVRKIYCGPHYGWPQDAVDAVLTTLLASNHLTARVNGNPLALADINQKKLGTADYRVEHPVLSATQKLKVRQLFKAANHKFSPGDELNAASGFLAYAKELAVKAGGEAPAPDRPSMAQWLTLETYTGNELLQALHDQKDVLEADIKKWLGLAKGIEKRLPTFQTAERLIGFTSVLAKHAAWLQQLQEIRTHRSLLAEPDPVAPLLQDVGMELRKACTQAHAQFRAAFEEQNKRLSQHELWSKLGPSDQVKLLHAAGALDRAAPVTGSDAELLSALEECDLANWQARTDALSAQFGKALNAAIKETEPKACHVTLAAATIHDAKEMETWLMQARSTIETALKEGPVIL